MKRLFLYLFLLSSALPLCAQVKGLGADVALYYRENGTISTHLSVSYGYRFFNHLSVDGGIVLVKTELNTLHPEQQTNVNYTIDNDYTYRIAGKMTTTYSIPIAFHSGLFVSGSFQFDLWPFDDVTLIKGISRTEEERKSKLIFSGFSPGVFGGGGIYHDFKSGNNSVRVSLGFEYGYYDYYYGYRHGTIDGQDLSKYVNKDKYSYRIALRICSF
jgi:hypothetical protein